MLTRFLIAASALAMTAACSNETPSGASAPADVSTPGASAPDVAATSPTAPVQATVLAAPGAPDARPAMLTSAPPSGPEAAPLIQTAEAGPSPPAQAGQAPRGPASVPYVSSNTVTNYHLPIARIANFRLKDQNGKTHELYKMTDAKVIVLTMHTKGCPIGQQLMPDFNALHAKYEPLGVKFLMMNSNTYDTPAMIAQEARDFSVTIPILKDPDQSVGEPLGVERSTESLVIEPGTWRILYQGPINDRVTYGRARARADVHYASAVIDAMLAGKAVQPSYIAPEGCILTFENRS